MEIVDLGLNVGSIGKDVMVGHCSLLKNWQV